METSPLRSPTTRLAALALAAACALVLALAPAAARADVSVDSFTARPAATTAGGHSDFTIEAAFSYPSGDDDLKGLVFHLPPGLVGNPQATPKCTQQQFEADQCPAETQVGTTSVSSTVTVVALPVPLTSDGKVYNLAPAGAEPARLGIVLAPVGGLLGKIMLTSPVNLRTATDFGIDSSVDDMPTTVSGNDVRIDGLSLTLNGVAGDPPLPFMSNPTSCGPAQSTVEAVSYGAPAAKDTASDSFTPTDCDKLPFTPRIQASMGAPGVAGEPAFSATITQAPGEANTKAATVTLPAELGANVAGVSVLCSAADFAARACPADSRVGSGKVVSPLLDAPLTGGAYAVARPNDLPGVGIVLSGPLDFNLQGAVALSQTIQIQNTFGGLPDVPLSSFNLTVDSGPKSLLSTAPDLCKRATPTVTGKFTGHSGKTADVSAPVAVVGCAGGGGASGSGKAPRASATARGFRNAKKPRLAVTVKSGAGGTNLKRVVVKLPRDIRVKSRRKGTRVTSSAALGRRYWTLSKKGVLTLKLPDNGARRAVAKLGRKAVGPSKRLAKRLKRHKSVTYRLRVTVTDPNGKKTTLKPKLKVRR